MWILAHPFTTGSSPADNYYCTTNARVLCIIIIREVKDTAHFLTVENKRVLPFSICFTDRSQGVYAINKLLEQRKLQCGLFSTFYIPD